MSYTPLFLDAAGAVLVTDTPGTGSHVAYDATDGRAVFDHRFDEDTELVGGMALRLWVETDGATDMDLFVGVQKIDADGNEVNYPFFSTMDDGHVALGWLRVSRRELDETASTPERPVLRHQQDLPLEPGQIVPVDIEIWPSGTVFHAGESLRLIVQGHDLNIYAEDLFAQRHA